LHEDGAALHRRLAFRPLDDGCALRTGRDIEGKRLRRMNRGLSVVDDLEEVIDRDRLVAGLKDELGFASQLHHPGDGVLGLFRRTRGGFLVGRDKQHTDGARAGCGKRLRLEPLALDDCRRAHCAGRRNNEFRASLRVGVLRAHVVANPQLHWLIGDRIGQVASNDANRDGARGKIVDGPRDAGGLTEVHLSLNG
jgi:hypothetical protein